MIPHEPSRQPQFGFLYFKPLRVQGLSIAGEETAIQIPEFDICFDIGRAPRIAVTSDFIALSHGHMDHSAGLPYYFSQRHFQGMPVGNVVCHPALEQPIRKMMLTWADIETQRTPFNIITLQPDDDSSEIELKNDIFLRAFNTNHTVPSLGYTIIEKRSKLKPELLGLPQERIKQLKQNGSTITYNKLISHVAFTGDTATGDFFQRDDVKNAQILITECTFMENTHSDRARLGKHMHIDDIIDQLPNLNNQAIVLTHLSRRTHIAQAREYLDKLIPPAHRQRVFLLMDTRAGRERYQQQQTDSPD